MEKNLMTSTWMELHSCFLSNSQIYLHHKTLCLCKTLPNSSQHWRNQFSFITIVLTGHYHTRRRIPIMTLFYQRKSIPLLKISWLLFMGRGRLLFHRCKFRREVMTAAALPLLFVYLCCLVMTLLPYPMIKQKWEITSHSVCQPYISHLL